MVAPMCGQLAVHAVCLGVETTKAGVDKGTAGGLCTTDMRCWHHQHLVAVADLCRRVLHVCRVSFAGPHSTALQDCDHPWGVVLQQVPANRPQGEGPGHAPSRGQRCEACSTGWCAGACAPVGQWGCMLCQFGVVMPLRGGRGVGLNCLPAYITSTAQRPAQCESDGRHACRRCGVCAASSSCCFRCCSTGSGACAVTER